MRIKTGRLGKCPPPVVQAGPEGKRTSPRPLGQRCTVVGRAGPQAGHAQARDAQNISTREAMGYVTTDKAEHKSQVMYGYGGMRW